MITDSYGNRRFYGLYRGIVTANNDPIGKGRVRLQVPQVLGKTQTDWAWPQQTHGVTVASPALNQGVWVMFEGGDPSFPIWTGVFSNTAVLSLSLDELSDVNVAGATNGQVLKYDATTKTWGPGVGGGSSVGALDDLTDVTLTTIANGNTLVYNSSLTQWVNVTTVPPGGTSGQILTKSSNTDYATAWIDNYADWTEVVKHVVRADENIAKGQAVYVSSANGTNMFVSKAANTSDATSSKTMGIAASAITTTGPTSTGYVITEGLLGGLDTSTATAGDPIWLGTGGNLIFGLANKPIAPAHLVFLGIVTKVSAGNGEIFVKVENGFELNELHNVLIGTNYSSTPANKDLLAYETSSSLWKNKTAAALGIVTTSDTGTVTNTMLAGSISNTKLAGGITNSQLVNSYVVINGTTFDLGDNKTITVSGSNFAAQSANTVFAGPATGASADPAFRSLVEADIPTLTVAGKVSNSATTATSSNTASTIVLRDASGNFSAGTITGAVTNLAGSTAGTIPYQTGTATAYTAAAAGANYVLVSGTSGTGQPQWTTTLPGVTSVNGTTIPASSTLATTTYVDARLTVGTTPPGSPQDEDLWYDSTDGTLYIRYNDGVGSPANQWVQIATNASIDTTLTNRVSVAEGNITTLQSDVTALETSFNILSSNFIINGAFDIWQRGTTSSTTANYIADRWMHTWLAGTATATQSTDIPTWSGLQYSLSLASTSGTNPAIQQRIESNNSARFAGQSVTLSVWAKSSVGTGALNWATYYPVSTDNFTAVTADASGTFEATMTVGTWTRYSATFTANALATRGYTIQFFRNVTTTSTTTLYAGAQLELGSTMTAFRRNAPSIQAELAACQRYYYRWNVGATPNVYFGSAIAGDTTTATVPLVLPVNMRRTVGSADFETSGSYTGAGSGVVFTASLNTTGSNNQIAAVTFTRSSGTHSVGAAFAMINQGSNGYLGFSAEL